MQSHLEKSLWSILTFAIYLLMGTMLLAALLITLPILLVVLCLDVNSFYRTFGYFRTRKSKEMLPTNPGQIGLPS